MRYQWTNMNIPIIPQGDIIQPGNACNINQDFNVRMKFTLHLKNKIRSPSHDTGSFTVFGEDFKGFFKPERAEIFLPHDYLSFSTGFSRNFYMDLIPSGSIISIQSLHETGKPAQQLTDSGLPSGEHQYHDET
jgi:hypothetical protein